MYHFSTIKGIVPDADANATPETCYLDYPREVKVSEDCVFLCVTTYRGVIHVLRIPEPPIPFAEEKQDEQQTSIRSGDELKLNFDTDISKVQPKDLLVKDLVVRVIQPPVLPVGPPVYVDAAAQAIEDAKALNESPKKGGAPPAKAPANPKDKGKEAEVTEPEKPTGPKYKFGKFKQDGSGGDAGCLL